MSEGKTEEYTTEQLRRIRDRVEREINARESTPEAQEAEIKRIRGMSDREFEDYRRGKA